jgi:hypothetical protein
MINIISSQAFDAINFLFWFFGLLNPFSRLPKTTCIMQDNVRQVMGKKEALDIRNDEVIGKNV